MSEPFGMGSRINEDQSRERIIGLGDADPHGRDNVQVDVRKAILMDTVNVSVVGAIRKGEMEEVVLALELQGRVNKRDYRRSELFIFDADGAAAIISELFGLAQRVGPEFSKLLEERLAALP